MSAIAIAIISKLLPFIETWALIGAFLIGVGGYYSNRIKDEANERIVDDN